MNTAQLANVSNSFEELLLIDTLLYQKKYDEALEAYAKLLANLGSHFAKKDQVRDFHHGDALDEGADICQRAAHQWRQILQSDLVLDDSNLGEILRNLHVLHAVIMGTYSGNLDDFIVAYHLQRNGQYDRPALIRQLLAWCPNSRSDFNPFAYYQHAPGLVLSHAVACLLDLALVSDLADKARHRAIDFLLAEKVKPEQLSRFRGINLVALAWMRCSYADDDRKHRIKPYLTQVIERQSSLPRTFLLPEKHRLHNGKPVLFIPLEGMTRDHAMYRCYAELILSCRKCFYTVGLGVDSKCDESVAALFDHFELVENSSYSDAFGKAIEQVQKIITDWTPAMVWFPSIGMDRWVILLSNRRMAPLQVMSLGHPATSMSREIDAAVVSADIIGDPDCFSEALIAMPRAAVRYQLPADIECVAPLRELPERGVIRIAIPSVVQKLTAAFIRCLREVQERATRPVEFVFFSGEFGVFHAAAAHNLLRELNHIVIHGTLPYSTYIREINRCQLHACTFPFGGTNSLLDSLRQGLPLVTLEGREAHARIDAAFVRKVGLPESLICHDERAYVECLLHLVEHPDELQRLRLFLLDEVDVDKAFLQDGNPELFADLMYRLYQGGRDGLKVAGGDVVKPPLSVWP
jgi:hypothetical protein